jgi:cytochrome oxidase Cu insertion factor (SCO1/SenC/PrrC family)
MRSASLLAAAAAAVGAQLPRQAPELAIGIPGGKPVLLSAYKGKAVCVAFILTTCPHCQATTNILIRMQKEYAARGLQVLESAVEVGGEAMVPRFVQQFNPQFPVGFNEFAVAQDFMQHSPMLIMHMPGLVFIDRQGRIVSQYEGDDPFMNEEQQEGHIRAEIEKLLKPAAPARKTAGR